MHSITLLHDHQCETLSGGSGWGPFINISSKSISGVKNNVYQTNSAVNMGGGGWGYHKGGYGKVTSISNLQANGAELVSVVL